MKARTWDGPTRAQRALIARKGLELLGIPYPSADEAEAVCARLVKAVEEGNEKWVHDDIPF